MIASTILALALTTAGTPTPVRGVVEILPAASAAAAGSSQPNKVRKPTQYCVRGTFTGSRIPRLVCRTRAEWLIEGFDPMERN